MPSPTGYQVLARKWRPKSFADMVGQHHVVRALSNALKQNRLHHAYLFTGTRGVGKTTVARIIAKCLNCETGITDTPCEQCSACQEINAGRFIDLIEVDAASRTKVEDTRELLDNVQYKPTKGRYKVYLIDEVHMLSGHSFNALLKTLEEPPPHVKFLLATTDPQKLPMTVLSRCLQFHLKNLTIEQIATQLAFILEKESLKFEEPALQHLARAADGSMRDALSLLDQAIAHGDGDVNLETVRAMLGSIAPTHLYGIIDALIQQDAQAIYTQTQSLSEHGVDFSQVLEELLGLLHQMALLHHLPQLNSSLFEDNEKPRELAQQLSAEQLQLYYQIAILGRRDLPMAPTPRAGFEITLLRMLAFYPEKTAPATSPSQQAQRTPVSSGNQARSPMTNARVTNSAPKVEPSVSNLPPQQSAMTSTQQTSAGYSQTETQSTAQQASAKHSQTETQPTNQQASARHSQTETQPTNQQASAKHSQTETQPTNHQASAGHSQTDTPPTTQQASAAHSHTETPSTAQQNTTSHHEATATKSRNNSAPLNTESWDSILPHLKLSGAAFAVAQHCTLISITDNEVKLQVANGQAPMINDRLRTRFQEALSEALGKSLRVEFNLGDSEQSTPAQKQAAAQEVKQQQAQSAIHQDKNIQAILSTFDATILPDSVEPTD